MTEWTGVIYREFYDVPRMVVARRGDETFLFYSRFDEELDDYIGHYEVWAMPPLSEAQLQGSWVGLESLAVGRLPDVAIRSLPFVVPRRGESA